MLTVDIGQESYPIFNVSARIFLLKYFLYAIQTYNLGLEWYIIG